MEIALLITDQMLFQSMFPWCLTTLRPMHPSLLIQKMTPQVSQGESLRMDLYNYLGQFAYVFSFDTSTDLLPGQTVLDPLLLNGVPFGTAILNLSSNLQVTFIPAQGVETGSVTIPYTLVDNFGNSVDSTVTFTIKDAVDTVSPNITIPDKVVDEGLFTALNPILTLDNPSTPYFTNIETDDHPLVYSTSYAVVTNGVPGPTISGLPDGLSVGNSLFTNFLVIGGRVEEGTYNITITATNPDPNNVVIGVSPHASQTFMLTVNEIANEVVNPSPSSVTSFSVTEAHVYLDTTAGCLFDASTLFTLAEKSDVTFTASYIDSQNHTQAGLPDGIHIDSAGLIYGTPTAVGSFNNIIITASDGDTALGGTASAMLTLKVIPDYTVTSMSLPSPSNTITASDAFGGGVIGFGTFTQAVSHPEEGYTFIVSDSQYPSGDPHYVAVYTGPGQFELIEVLPFEETFPPLLRVHSPSQASLQDQFR